MSTYTSIHQSSFNRLQAQMAETRLVKSFREEGLAEGALAPRVARGGVKRIRQWHNGRFVSTPLFA